ncbi:MAG: MATE family efflux transporter [Bacteroidia bacterium]|nr:MATE family efflux transporter [Bacteroidia bacterium]
MTSISTRKSYSEHFIATLQLSIPVIIGQVGQYLMGFIDNLMIGQISYVHLSAGSLANIFYFVLTILGLGITFAISPLVAEANGAGDKKKAGEYLVQGVWVAFFSSIILGLAVYFAADLMKFMDQPEEDVALALPYTKILSYSVFPMLLFLVAKQWTDGLSLTLPAMIITLIGLVFNTFINWLLIFGNWGFPRLELDGAGYGTLASRSLMAILMVVYIIYNKRFKDFSLREGWLSLKSKPIGRILYLGVPSGFQYFFEVAAFGGSTLMIGLLDNGSAYRAAHQIAIQMAAMAYMVVLGFSAGASIRVGNALGRKDYANVRYAGLTGIYLAAGFMVLAAVLFVLGQHAFPRIFTDDPFVLDVASKLMLIAGAFALFDGIQGVGVGILRGIQDVMIPTVITFIAYWIINLPIGYFLGFNMGLGVYGIWYGFVISLFLTAVFLTWRFWQLTGKLMHKEEVVASGVSV